MKSTVRLLDFDRAGKFVVVVFGDAAMLEFQFGVEDDRVGDLQSREEDDALGVEAVLPMAGFFLTTELQLAVCADAQDCLAAIAEAKKSVRLRCFERVARSDHTTFPRWLAFDRSMGSCAFLSLAFSFPCASYLARRFSSDATLDSSACIFLEFRRYLRQRERREARVGRA